MKEFRGGPSLDASPLAAARAVEHYEIAPRDTETSPAELGMNQAVKLLEATLAGENKTDAMLTKFAESEVNQHAQAAGGPFSIDGSDASPPRGVPAVVSQD